MTDPQDQPAEPARAPRSVAILGAGPVGLDAALAAADAGWPFRVYEAAGAVAGNVRRWGHVRLFTPWPMNVSERMRRHLTAAGVPVPDGADCPTGHELVDRLLRPLADLPELAGHFALGTRVTAIGRAGLLKHEQIATPERAEHPFRLVLDGPDGADTATADLVLDCTGTYGNPNAAGDGGIPAPGERELGERVVRVIPDLAADAESWAGRRVLLVGAGKSAQTVAWRLAELVSGPAGGRLVWAVRSPKPDWGEVADDTLPHRQALVESSRRLADGAEPAVRVLRGVAVDRFTDRDDGIVARLSDGGEVTVDTVLALTGYVPDASLYRQLQVHECYATAAPIELSAQLLGDAAGDCLQQQSYGVDVLRSPEPNFFLLGAKSYGRNSQFLMRTGYEQVDEVAGAYRPAR